MRPIRIIMGVLLALTLFAASPTVALVASSTTRTEETVEIDLVNSCNGEAVAFTGTLTVVSKVRDDGRIDEQISVRADGTGDAGNRYVLRYRAEFRTDSDGTYRSKIRVVAANKGTGPSLAVRAEVRTDGGEVTVDTYSERCRD